MRQSNKPQTEMTAAPNKYPQGVFKDKPCKHCGEVFSPKGPSHKFCSEDCKSFADTDKYYKRVYGIGLTEVKQLEEKQKGCCAICGGESFKMHPGIKQILCLDHCHISGNVRGLLCHNCNRALGLFKDSKETLSKALEYLESATTIPQGSTLK